MLAINFWTKEKVERLRELWPTSAADSEIGKLLGCTRGAVAGKARRIGLPKRGQPQERGKPRAAPKVKAAVARVKLPSVAQAKQGLIKTRGSARNPGFTIQHGLKATKTELREMLKAAVENTK